MSDARCRELLTLGDKGVARLARRGYELRLAELESVHRERTDAVAELDLARAELKRSAKGREAATEERRVVARLLRERVQRAEGRFREAPEQLTGLLTTVPNIPLDEVPEGRTEAVEVRRCGPPPAPADESRHHAAVGAALGILDAERAAKLSGARFSVARGAGARLERALAAFFLDLHTGAHGYTEYSVPYLVTRETMTGTGQLPKFEEDLFATRVGDRELC